MPSAGGGALQIPTGVDGPILPRGVPTVLLGCAIQDSLADTVQASLATLDEIIV